MTNELKPTALDLACQTLAGFHPELRDAPEILRDARAELASLRRAPSEAVGLLRALMDRLDSHFGGPSNDWKEQEQARRFLAAQDKENT